MINGPPSPEAYIFCCFSLDFRLTPMNRYDNIATLYILRISDDIVYLTLPRERRFSGGGRLSALTKTGSLSSGFLTIKMAIRPLAPRQVRSKILLPYLTKTDPITPLIKESEILLVVQIAQGLCLNSRYSVSKFTFSLSQKFI